MTTPDSRAALERLVDAVKYGDTSELAAAMKAAAAALAAEPAPPADGEVAELPPRPPLMKPPAHPALERYGVTWDGSPDKPLLTRRADGYWTPWHVAADLLERLAPQPVPEGPSLKEQALSVLDDISDQLDAAHENTIRRALEALPND